MVLPVRLSSGPGQADTKSGTLLWLAFNFKTKAMFGAKLPDNAQAQPVAWIVTLAHVGLSQFLHLVHTHAPTGIDDLKPYERALPATPDQHAALLGISDGI